MAESIEFILSMKDLMSKGLADINKKLEGIENKTGKANKKLKETPNILKNISGSLVGLVSVGAALSFGKQILYTTAKFESLSNAIKFASDTSLQGELSLGWISNMSKKYGLPLQETAEGFKIFQGAMMKTKFSSNEVRKMFAQVSTGAVAMGLDAENTKGVFLALGQIMGKGKVQAEELRGQIGERVPGAFAIAARAMKMTTAELDKFMADGKLMSEDFLPKFAEEMEKTFGAGAEKNMNSLNSNINRVTNSWDEFILAIGQSDQDGLMSKTLNLISRGIDNIADKFRTMEQNSKRAVNQDVVNYLGNYEAQIKKEVEAMKAAGASKKEIDKFITEERQKNNFDSAIEAQNLNKVKLDIEKMRGLYGTNLLGQKITNKDREVAREGIYKEDENYRSAVDNITKYYEQTKGKAGVLDKIISDIYKENGLASANKKTKATSTTTAATKGSKTLSNEVAKVQSRQPSNVYINIDAIIKGDVNNMINNANNPQQDLNNFLVQIENALLSVVNDVNLAIK